MGIVAEPRTGPTAWPVATRRITRMISRMRTGAVAAPLPEPISEDSLVAAVAWLVVHRLAQFGWAIPLVGPRPRLVVGIDVALPVAYGGGTPIVGISKVGRHLSTGTLPHITLGPTQGDGDPVRLRCAGQVYHRLGQIELGLGQAHEFHRSGGGIGHHQRQRV